MGAGWLNLFGGGGQLKSRPRKDTAIWCGHLERLPASSGPVVTRRRFAAGLAKWPGRDHYLGDMFIHQ
jgi:hypothetical protein